MRRFLVTAIAIAFLAVFIEWQSAGRASEHRQSDAFWAFTYVNGQEVEVFDSIDELSTAVDTVVLGTISRIGDGRSLQALKGDGSVETVWYGQVVIDVERTYAGTDAPSLTFEAFLPDRESLEQFRTAAIPVGRTLFFIRNMQVAALAAGWTPEEAAAEANRNMLVNLSQSYFRELGGRVHVAAPGSGDFTDAWEGRSFADLLTEVEGLTRDPSGG